MHVTVGSRIPAARLLRCDGINRYRRAEQRSWITRWLVLFDQPPSPTFTMRSLRYVEHFVPDGYAYVTVDTRGAGASFGTKPNDLLPREIADLKEVSDWVVRQDWCNGRIGTGGISYDGIMGAEAAAQGNIAAVALLHSYADIYDDLVLPGGVPNTGFLSLYGAFTSASEQNVPAVHPDLTWGFVLADLLFAGTAGVDPNNPTQLDAAVAEHSDNYNMAAKITDPAFLCKDSVVVTANGSNYTWTDLSNTEVTANALVSHRVSVAAWAGYQDSGSVRSAARMHNALVAAGAPSRLTIGPWVHGGRTCWTPAGGAERGEPSFSLDLAVKRFFDCELRDQCDVFGSAGGAQDPPLHFFMSGTAGPDEWRAAPDQWPPAGLVWHDLYMHTVDKSLRPHAVEDARLSADFRVNFRATTGKASRWNLVLHLLKVLVTYPTRGEDAARMLSRSTAPLESDINIVGSAHVDVVLELVAPLTATEAVVFVYLEDVDPDGAVTYITEGQVRAAHPVVNTADDARVGSFNAFSRSFTCSDMQPLTAGVPAAISILLEPIA
jgi:putative CocE/NonD family hydrolase